MERENTTDELLEQIYREYREPLLRHLYRLVGNGELAEDLCQDTFVKVVLHRDKVAAIDYTAAWLFRIATNTAYDHLRRRGKVGITSLDTEEPGGLRDTLHANCPAEQPGSNQIDEALDIRSTLDQLCEHKRLPLVLHYYAGYSLEDIAAVMATGTGTVRSRLFRAREKFRELYAA